MWNIIYIFVVLISVIYLPEQLNGSDIQFKDAFWIPKELVFMIGSSVVIGYYFSENKNIGSLKNRIFGIIFGFIVISSLLRFMLPLIFNGINGRIFWNLFLIRPTINFILGSFLVYVLVSGSTIENWVKLSKLFAYLGFGFACYAILQWCGIDQIFGKADFNYTNGIFERKILMVTFLANNFLTSNFISVLSPFCLMFKETRFKIFYIVCGAAILLTQTTIAFVSYFIGLFVYLLMNRKFKVLFVTCGLSLIMFFVMCKFDRTFMSDTGRYTLWWNIITTNSLPFFGNGTGSFIIAGFTSGKLQALHAHNEWLQFYYEGGLVLVVMSLMYMFDLIKRIWSEYIENNSIILIGFTSAFFSYLVVMSGGFPLRIASLALIFILIISCLESLTRRLV